MKDYMRTHFIEENHIFSASHVFWYNVRVSISCYNKKTGNSVTWLNLNMYHVSNVTH